MSLEPYIIWTNKRKYPQKTQSVPSVNYDVKFQVWEMTHVRGIGTKSKFTCERINAYNMKQILERLLKKWANNNNMHFDKFISVEKQTESQLTSLIISYGVYQFVVPIL